MADVQTRGITLTEAVIRRPGMYTVNGSFAEVLCFLEGYYSGVAKGNYSAPPVVEWSDFRHWLAQRFGVTSTESFRLIQKSHDDDCERLKELSDLYILFQTEQLGKAEPLYAERP